MKKPLQLVVGVSTLLIVLGAYRVTPAGAVKRHLVWDPVDLQWLCEGSPKDCGGIS